MQLISRVAFTLLSTAVLAVAQSQWHSTTVTGCLKYASGAYSLIETHGYAIYAVSGGQQDLRPMINHEVTITGRTTEGVTSSAGVSDNTKTGSLPPLRVDSIQSVLTSCKKK